MPSESRRDGTKIAQHELLGLIGKEPFSPVGTAEKKIVNQPSLRDCSVF